MLNRIRRPRAAKIYTVRLHGAEGRGPTKTDAKLDACAQIERAMDATYSPAIIRWRGVLGILYCDRGHYAYTLIHEDSESYQDGTIIAGCSCCGTDRRAALVSLKTHLAQIGWTHEDGQTVPFILKGCPEETHREHLHQAAWQEAYQHARTLGMEYNDAHYWACNHSHEFALPCR